MIHGKPTTHTVDAFIKPHAPTWHAVDAFAIHQTPIAHTVDAFIKPKVPTWHAVDAFLVKSGVGNEQIYDTLAGGTFTVPTTGTYHVQLWGPGGNGGSDFSATGGGGGGEYAECDVAANAGDTFVCDTTAASINFPVTGSDIVAGSGYWWNQFNGLIFAPGGTGGGLNNVGSDLSNHVHHDGGIGCDTGLGGQTGGGGAGGPTGAGGNGSTPTGGAAGTGGGSGAGGDAGVAGHAAGGGGGINAAGAGGKIRITW